MSTDSGGCIDSRGHPLDWHNRSNPVNRYNVNIDSRGLQRLSEASPDSRGFYDYGRRLSTPEAYRDSQRLLPDFRGLQRISEASRLQRLDRIIGTLGTLGKL